jgi:phage repressor protein C with HTH and peptisase S24 domain
MEPYYYAGDEVACLKINEARFLQWGRVHVLDTTQGIVIKRIYDNGECIRCASFNPEYPDFNVPKEDIRSFNLVVGALRL